MISYLNPNRSNFIKTTSDIAAGTVIPFDRLSATRSRVSPNDKIQVALIVGNSMGYSNLASLVKNPEVECVAMCDIVRNVLERRTGDLVKLNLPKPANTFMSKSPSGIQLPRSI